MSVAYRLELKFYFVFQKGFSILQNNRGHITRQEGRPRLPGDYTLLEISAKCSLMDNNRDRFQYYRQHSGGTFTKGEWIRDHAKMTKHVFTNIISRYFPLKPFQNNFTIKISEIFSEDLESQSEWQYMRKGNPHEFC